MRGKVIINKYFQNVTFGDITIPHNSSIKIDSDKYQDLINTTNLNIAIKSGIVVCYNTIINKNVSKDNKITKLTNSTIVDNTTTTNNINLSVANSDSTENKDTNTITVTDKSIATNEKSTSSKPKSRRGRKTKNK